MFIQPKFLTPEELGLTRILLAAASLIATILPLGVSSVTTKFFPYFRNAEKKHHGYFGLMLIFPLAGTALCGILIYVFKDAIINEYQAQSPLFTRYFNLLLPFAMIIAVNMTLNAYCSSLFKTSIISLFESIVSRVLFIILIFIYYFHYITLTQFIELFVAIYIIQVISMTLYIYSLDTPSLRIDKTILKSIGTGNMIRFGLLLTLTNVSSVSLKHLDTLMLGKYMSLDWVGVFTVAAFIGMVIEIPLTSLEKITHTKVAQAWDNNDVESIKDIYYKSVKYLMLIGGLLLVCIICNINDLLSFLPEIYHKGATVAIIACIGSFLNIATGVNTSILFSSSKYIYGTYILLLLLLLSVVFNIILIPLYGITGAALATAISSVIYNLIKYLIILKHFKMQPYNPTNMRILLVIMLSFAAYFLPDIHDNLYNIILKSAVIAVIYGVSTYLFNVIPEYHHYFKNKK
jgi:O-antigen/teichoic acid export membrane protein